MSSFPGSKSGAEQVIAKTIFGVVVGVLIGAGCRFFEIPLPGPPAILGAFLAVAMATGYTLTDKVLAARTGAETPRVSADATPAHREPIKE
jgi:XapX domain-containing protein